MASPQFIPLKRGKECLAVNSWRDSPSTKPLTPPPSTPPQTSEDAKKRRRGKSKGPAAAEEAFDDFIVRCVVPGGSAVEVEQALAAADIKPLRVLDVGAPRSVPLKRLDGDSLELSNNAHHPKESPMLSGDNAHGDAGGDAGGGGLPPPMALPPNASSTALDNGHLICLMYAEQEHAEKAVVVVTKKWGSAVAEITPRRRAMLNASLVMKGLPFTTKCDKLVEELEKLTHKPSYVRLHRGERGVFKCVVFVKYSNRAVAEHSKLELERLNVGSRPLRVEFKKKTREDGQKHPSSLASLEQAVRDLRNSKENEGFFYTRSQLSKEEVRYLKHLSVSYDLILELTTENVTVKRRLAGEKPSPALKPSNAPNTPQWVPATPGSLLPMDFRGIRHWKEMRQASASAALGIMRPVGPGDAPPFSAGRGRPL